MRTSCSLSDSSRLMLKQESLAGNSEKADIEIVVEPFGWMTVQNDVGDLGLKSFPQPITHFSDALTLLGHEFTAQLARLSETDYQRHRQGSASQTPFVSTTID